MEQKFGHDFSNIRIHAGPAAAASARALGAEAFTVDRDVVFGAGQYDTSTHEGRRLLAHELAHVAHRARSSQLIPGVAPHDAAAERHADLAAEHLSDPSRRDPAKSPGHFRNWGPAWEVHRQVTKDTKGKVAYTGDVGRKPGEVGVPYGTVEVRTGEAIELKGGGKFPNVIAVEYKGLFSADMKWLQFVWFELTATTSAGTARISGSVPTSSGNKPFTNDPKNPSWSIDSASTTDPFYEATGADLRSSSSTTIFDAPGGGSATPIADAVFKALAPSAAAAAGAAVGSAAGGAAGASVGATDAGAGISVTDVTFTAHFEDYLIQTDHAVHLVSWQASTLFNQVKGTTTASAIGYTVGTSGPVAGMPADRQKLLAASYPKLNNIK
jgi:hypothetical protein